MLCFNTVVSDCSNDATAHVAHEDAVFLGFGQEAVCLGVAEIFLLGVAQGTVSKITTGARSITLDHAKRLARHFKMRPEGF